MFQLPQLNEPAELASVKCPHCKEVTPTEWIKVQPDWVTTTDDPFNDGPDYIEILTLTKRLSLCTKCGNMRLTN